MGILKTISNSGADPLSSFREKFHIPLGKNTSEDSEISDESEAIYFNGNSLGCQPKTTQENVVAVLDNWREKDRFLTYFLDLAEIYRYYHKPSANIWKFKPRIAKNLLTKRKLKTRA